MRRIIVTGLVVAILGVFTQSAIAQQPQRPRPPEPPRPTQQQPRPPEARPADATGEPAEIKLDENTALKAAKIEAQMRETLATLGLLQRQAQDIQQRWSKLLEERKGLVEEAGKKVNVAVQDSNVWVFDETTQRYVRARQQQQQPR